MVKDNTGYKLPFCNYVDITNQLCMACVKHNKELKCTALETTVEYWSRCPFFLPMCENRVNDVHGFKKCKALKSGYPCNGKKCPFYKEVKPF